MKYPPPTVLDAGAKALWESGEHQTFADQFATGACLFLSAEGRELRAAMSEDERQALTRKFGDAIEPIKSSIEIAKMTDVGDVTIATSLVAFLAVRAGIAPNL